MLIGVADGRFSAHAPGSTDEDDGNTLDTVASTRPTDIEPDFQAAVRGETADTVIEFADGSATTDGTFLSEFGERASRRAHPERWDDAECKGACSASSSRASARGSPRASPCERIFADAARP